MQELTIKSLSPVIWWVIVVNAFFRITRYMVVPFLALYMSAHTHASPGVIGLVIGVQAVTAAGSGFFAGTIADRFSRKIVMVSAMWISAISLTGFALAQSVSEFFVLSALNGLTFSVFDPAAQAVLTDVASAESLGTVFSIRYWSSNVGAGIGPILGGLLGISMVSWPFFLAGFLNLVAGLVVWKSFPDAKRKLQVGQQEKFRFKNAIQILFTDKALLLFLAATILVYAGYSQLSTTLPQYMRGRFGIAAGIMDYTMVFTLNPIAILLLQLPMTKVVHRMGTVRIQMVGQALFAVGYFAFSLSTTLWEFLFAMFLVTLGEMMVFPTNSGYIANLASARYRATYFGFYSLRSVGSFLGPWIGGTIFAATSGKTVFLVVSITSLFAVILYPVSHAFHKDELASHAHIEA